MRDLSVQELGFVYGAGCSPCPPSKKPKKDKCKAGRGSRSGSGKGSRSNSGGYRCGKGGSS